MPGQVQRQESMTATERFLVLALFLILHACSGDRSRGSEPGGEPGSDGGSATGILDLVDDLDPSTSSDAAVDHEADTGVGGGIEDADVTDAALSGDAATQDAGVLMDAGADAGHDAGQDAGPPPPPPLGGTCALCTVDADCEANNCLDRLGESVCLPPRIGMDYQCSTYPGNKWLYATGSSCVPYDKVAFKHLTCAEWHALTGL